MTTYYKKDAINKAPQKEYTKENVENALNEAALDKERKFVIFEEFTSEKILEIEKILKCKIDYGNAFRSSYERGYLEFALLLIELSMKTGSIIDLHGYDDSLFRWTCFSGNLERAQWLIKVGNMIKSPINIHAMDEYAFRFSCEHGDLDLAQWLLEIGTRTHSPINIHAMDDYAFHFSCENGHLTLAQWLIKVGKETNSPIDTNVITKALKCSLKNDYGYITTWLREY